MTHGKGENKDERWKKRTWSILKRVLGVRAAHRLDCGRVWCFPDWTICSVVIRGWRLKKWKRNTRNTLNSCSYFHSVHCKTVVKKNQNKIHWLVLQRIHHKVSSTNNKLIKYMHSSVRLAGRRPSWLITSLAAVGSNIPVDADYVWTVCTNTSRGATSS